MAGTVILCNNLKIGSVHFRTFMVTQNVGVSHWSEQGVSQKKKFCPLNVNWESFLDRSKSLCGNKLCFFPTCFSLDANNCSLVLYISFPVNEHWKIHPMALRFVYSISGDAHRLHFVLYISFQWIHTQYEWNAINFDIIFFLIFFFSLI
jgi:hypothetical protein